MGAQRYRHLIARYGDIERAVEIWELARTWPHVANSKWYESVIGQEITALASELSSEDVHAATNRGQALDFWQTAESLMDEL